MNSWTNPVGKGLCAATLPSCRFIALGALSGARGSKLQRRPLGRPWGHQQLGATVDARLGVGSAKAFLGFFGVGPAWVFGPQGYRFSQRHRATGSSGDDMIKLIIP